MIIVRYADDFIVGFQREADARNLGTLNSGGPVSGSQNGGSKAFYKVGNRRIARNNRDVSLGEAILLDKQTLHALPVRSSPHCLDRQRDALATADTQGDDVSCQAVAAHEDGPGGADRVTMRNPPRLRHLRSHPENPVRAPRRPR